MKKTKRSKKSKKTRTVPQVMDRSRVEVGPPGILGMHQVSTFSRKIKISNYYTGSARRAADARYARASKISTECEGGRKKRPMN